MNEQFLEIFHHIKGKYGYDDSSYRVWIGWDNNLTQWGGGFVGAQHLYTNESEYNKYIYQKFYNPPSWWDDDECGVIYTCCGGVDYWDFEICLK